MIRKQTLNKNDVSSPISTDDDWLCNEQAYRDGELARQNRQPFEACPFGTTDPFRVDWQRGWYSCRVAESDTDELLPALQRACLTVHRADLEELDTDRRFELRDWLDTLPREWLSAEQRAAFDRRRPTWVNMTTPRVPGRSRLRTISFVQAEA